MNGPPESNEPTPAPVETTELAGPVTESRRIISLDVLRGVAVMGILAMNMQAFAMVDAAYMNPTAFGDLEGLNYWVWYLGSLLANMKFITIFSMLFGAGIVLMTSKAEAATGRSAGVHYRRMLWLILFGLLHAHLLWFGDILYSYGMCGLVMYLFRRLPPWLLLTIGVVMLALAAGITIFFGLTMRFWPEEAIVDMASDWTPTLEQMQEQIAIYQGGWLDQMQHRVPMALMFQTFMLAIGIFWQAGGLMLIGMALYKLGVFTAARSTPFYILLAVIGLGIGLPTVAYGIHQHEAHGWDMKYSFFLGNQYNFWASPLVSLGYVALVMLVCRMPGTAAITRPLAAVGRMALSNYLLQTIICTTIFYGHGFGQFGQVERVGQIGIVAAIWVAQLIYSPIWLHYFRFGPFEWLWRSLTYWKLQPMGK